MAGRPTGPLTGQRLLGVLAETPARLTAVADGVAPADLRTPPGPDEWSAIDVLAHLRSCADVWGGCIETILREDSPRIRAVNPRTWIEHTDYLDLEFDSSLRAFTKQRRELLRILEPLSPDEWARDATVFGAGKTLTRTVLSYAQWLATHERPHVKQIDRTVHAVRVRTG